MIPFKNFSDRMERSSLIYIRPGISLATMQSYTSHPALVSNEAASPWNSTELCCHSGEEKMTMCRDGLCFDEAKEAHVCCLE